MVASHHQRAVEPLDIARSLGFDANGVQSPSQLLLAAQEIGLKGKSMRTRWSRLGKGSLPAIAVLESGDYVVLFRTDGPDNILVADPRKPRPERLDRAQLESVWRRGAVEEKSMG